MIHSFSTTFTSPRRATAGWRSGSGRGSAGNWNPEPIP